MKVHLVVPPGSFDQGYDNHEDFVLAVAIRAAAVLFSRAAVSVTVLDVNRD